MKDCGHVNRSLKRQAPLYCSKKCSGLARKKHKTIDQKRAEKAQYDLDRRQALGDVIRAKKRAAYIKAIEENPEKLRAEQKRNRENQKDRHAAYCRTPEYREWKKNYDRKFRARKLYGAFGDAFILLMEIESELDSRASKYERYQENGTLNKTQKRKREYEQQANGG